MKSRHVLLALGCVCLCVGATAKAADAPRKTPLDDYIARRDASYSWKLVKTIKGDGVTTYVLDLKSQTWRSVPEVDRPLWQHWLVIVRPDKVRHETVFLRIGGGANGGEAPGAASPQSIQTARV